MLDLIVNGKPRSAEDGLTVLGYLGALGINPQIVAVELNGDIVRREELDAYQLKNGDQLEIVRMVGGGAL
ncbi:MAG: sulfur carrier protein ThiS [Chloroflexi bacterium]|nr:sulfur carrier protein ThiS [Chloroflexota bacterium]